MKLFELINPSDPYTFEAPDLAVAGALVCILGEGMYGAEPLHEADGSVPMFPIDGHEEWFEALGASFEDTIRGRKAEIAEAMDSLLIGTFSDRAEFAVSGMSWHEWHDSRRSSINDIGKRAKHFAKAMREMS